MAYRILIACGSEKLNQEIECVLGLAEDEFLVSSLTKTENIIKSITDLNPDILIFDVHFVDGATADML
ncbi:MAG TPA: hypothetical protein P5145_04495, partial [Tenuifilaceae bacterium]|nr:hypothetical protein [Tenuifilaceae bacterium]